MESPRDAVFEVTLCLLPEDPNAAESAVRGVFAKKTVDVVEIGSKIRTSHDYTLVFERNSNTMGALHPGVWSCFNDSPETTLQAVRRGFTGQARRHYDL
ncbi:hypothetical protein ACT3TP_16800 [Glutamicibacter sp. AOP38-B1-38]|uniref:hypothetical protein n=1 Tax=Glutamicibacter sp. AOP38-B1-38 TaxID=3457680 RepID=UPI004034D979